MTANNQIIGKGYPRHLGSTYSYGWRSQEIVDALSANPRLSVAQSLALQGDDTVRFADELVPRLLKLKVSRPVGRRGSADPGRLGLLVVRRTRPRRRTSSWSCTTSWSGPSATRCREELWPTGGDRWNAVLTKLLDDPNNAWWDDENTKGIVEKRDDILRAAMTDARKELTSLMSRDTPGWQWGKLHRVTLRHQTLGSSGIGPIERLFNRGDWPVGGGPAVVNAMAFDDTRGYRVTAGPTMRMVVDLDDPDNSRWINQSGTSGHAYHPNYDDQAPLWVTNQTVRFVAGRSAVESLTEHRLNLVPTG